MGAGMACAPGTSGCAVQSQCNDCTAELQDMALRCNLAGAGHKWDQSVLTNLALLRAAGEGDVVAICDALAAGADIEVRRQPLIRPQDPRVNEWGEHDSPPPPPPPPQEIYDLHDNDSIASGSMQGTSLAKSASSQEGAYDNADTPSSNRRHGLTPLMTAAKEGHLQAVLFLLQSQASLDSEDEDGMRPLHFAAVAGARDCCEALLYARACPAALDDIGRDGFACVPREFTLSRAERSRWRKLMHPVGHLAGQDEDNVAHSNLSRPASDKESTWSRTGQQSDCDYTECNYTIGHETCEI